MRDLKLPVMKNDLADGWILHCRFYSKTTDKDVNKQRRELFIILVREKHESAFSILVGRCSVQCSLVYKYD